MTAHTLARLLLDGPDLPVYVNGYEGGLTDVTTVDAVRVERDYRTDAPTYFGRHDQVSPWGTEPEAGEPGLLLPR